MRIATARDEMKKPVRTISIKDGKFCKWIGKFRLYNSNNSQVMQSASRLLPYIPIFSGVRGTSKVTWVRVAYPWSYSASSEFTWPGPLCTAGEEALNPA